MTPYGFDLEDILYRFVAYFSKTMKMVITVTLMLTGLHIIRH